MCRPASLVERSVKGVQGVNFYRVSPCPACSKAVVVSRLIFLPNFACPHCGAAIKFSLLYGRSLVILACLLGYALAWEVSRICPPAYLFGIPALFLLLWIPIGYLTLTVLVRVVPFFIRPKLVLEWPSEFATLSLTSRRGEDHPQSSDEGRANS
jgi:hypothetical protein